MTIEAAEFEPVCHICSKPIVKREDLRMHNDYAVHAACWMSKNSATAPASTWTQHFVEHRTPVHPEAMSHPLFPVLCAAIEQAMFGKGVRHGGATVPFLEQPIFHYAKMHGRGFLTGQAAKKLEEAASTRHGDAFRTEVLGAIVYAAAAVLWDEKTHGQDA